MNKYEWYRPKLYCGLDSNILMWFGFQYRLPLFQKKLLIVCVDCTVNDTNLIFLKRFMTKWCARTSVLVEMLSRIFRGLEGHTCNVQRGAVTFTDSSDWTADFVGYSVVLIYLVICRKQGLPVINMSVTQMHCSLVTVFLLVKFKIIWPYLFIENM